MAVRKKLGDLLIEGRAIDELQLKAALAHQRQWGGRIGRILVEMRFVSEQQICDAVARQLGIPSVRLFGRTVDPALLELVPKELCERHWVFPLGVVPGERGSDKLQVAMSDPTNLAVVDELRFRTGKHIEVAVAPDSQIDAAIRRYFYGETVADQRPRHGGPIAEIQFGGQEVDFADSGAVPRASALGPPPASPAVVAPDPLGDLFGGPDAHDELDALLGFADPALADAASPAGGAEAIDAARRALFAAPGGLAADGEDGGSPFPAEAWSAAAAPAPVTPAPAGWPPPWNPVSGSAPGAPSAPLPAGDEDPAWGEPEILEELEVGLDDSPLVVGTLIESSRPAQDGTPDGPSGESLELDPAEPADPLDPLADEAALIAALESMAAGHEEPLPAGRVVAALALALIHRGVIRGGDLLDALR